jgi:hypothetical protein
VADEDLPDPLEPGASIPHDPLPTPQSPVVPKGDVRIPSWVALGGGVLVVAWYLSVLVLGGVYLGDLAAPAQIGIWLLALVSFGCGLWSLNARRARELAAAGFIAGVVSLLVTISIGLPTGFQVLF